MPFVNVYLVDLQYGGPEEGDWFFRTGEPVRSIPASTQRDAERAFRLTSRIVDRLNVGRPDIASIASCGRYEAQIERRPARRWPAKVPRYE